MPPGSCAPSVFHDFLAVCPRKLRRCSSGLNFQQAYSRGMQSLVLAIEKLDRIFNTFPPLVSMVHASPPSQGTNGGPRRGRRNYRGTAGANWPRPSMPGAIHPQRELISIPAGYSPERGREINYPQKQVTNARLARHLAAEVILHSDDLRLKPPWIFGCFRPTN